MHVFLIAKVKADSAKEAVDEAHGLIESSINDDENTTGWDYADKSKVITKNDLSGYGCKTFKELEKKYADRDETIRHLMGCLRSNLAPRLVARHMPQEEAPLHLSRKNEYGHEDKEFHDAVEKVLKSKKGGNLPKSFDELEQAILKVIKEIATEDRMDMYYLKKVNEVGLCKQYPDDKYKTLQCTENHFADLTGETSGSKTFYVSTSRHI